MLQCWFNKSAAHCATVQQGAFRSWLPSRNKHATCGHPPKQAAVDVPATMPHVCATPAHTDSNCAVPSPRRPDAAFLQV